MRFSWRVKDRTVNFSHIPDIARRQKRVFDELDATHFQTLITFVAGIGFLTDGYDIFAVGMTIPMLAHVYWDGAMPTAIETGMRVATLVGIVIGQLAFGVLGDLYGRRKMYGFELLVVLVATIGVVMAAEGASSSMSLVGWLVSWRFVMGIGIGADYPLSAVITSEFAPTKSRARMIATVFYMQPCGYLIATLVAILALLGHRNSIPQNIPTTLEEIKSCTSDELCHKAVDSVWRWVIGIGAVPPAIAMFFRFTIPESPRYTMEVLNRPDDALQDVNEMTGSKSSRLHARVTSDVEMHAAQANGSPVASRPSSSRRPGMVEDSASRVSTHESEAGQPPHSSASSVTTVDEPTNNPTDGSENDSVHADLEQASRWHIFSTRFHDHFVTKGHWPTLVGTASAWACFDFAFYALGPNSYRVVSKIFNESDLRFTSPKPLPLPDRSIYSDLLENTWHSLVIVSIGSMLGGLVMIKLIKRNSPRAIQYYGFLGLAVLFIVIGILFQKIPRDGSSVPLISFLYILCQFFFEVGPNFTTFMLPAELFPTRFRCTAHGISAAAGKVASVLVQVFVSYAPIGRHRSQDPGVVWLGWVVIIFAVFMVLGGVVTKLLVPETRLVNGENRPLEQLEKQAQILRPVPCKAQPVTEDPVTTVT